MANYYPIEWVLLGGDSKPNEQSYVTTDVLEVPGGVLVRCIAHVTSNAGSLTDNTSMTISFVPGAELDMTDRNRPALRFSTRHLDA